MLQKNKKHTSKKVLFAVGGTGGHLFPAQALARDLCTENFEVLFAGGKLGSNPFFHPLQFPFREVQGASPFRSNPFKASFQLLSGIREAIKIVQEFTPDYVIGFGSFYSFPVLAAARLKKIPYVLVESNAYPGKVNRLFSAKSCFCAVQFEEAYPFLKGKVIPTQIPFWARENASAFLEKKEARKYFKLDPDRFTLLIFGGSQGAASLNRVAALLENDLQVIHLCGKDENIQKLRTLYKEKAVMACVKPFEEQMHIALRASDLALSRAGGGTLNELIEFCLPSILVPWPKASENHQYKNAKILADKGGAILLEQKNLASFPAHLQQTRGKLEMMRSVLQKEKQKKIKTLSEIIQQQLMRE